MIYGHPIVAATELQNSLVSSWIYKFNSPRKPRNSWFLSQFYRWPNKVRLLAQVKAWKWEFSAVSSDPTTLFLIEYHSSQSKYHVWNVYFQSVQWTYLNMSITFIQVDRSNYCKRKSLNVLNWDQRSLTVFSCGFSPD